MAIAIVCATFNKEITDKMLDTAMKEAEERGLDVVSVIKVPGAFDIPFVVRQLLEDNDVEGVAALGAIVKGETGHDEVIGQALANQLAMLSCEYGKPVSLGVIGPGATMEQAEARADEYAKRAVSAVEELLRLFEQ